jgi:hypothetical protein
MEAVYKENYFLKDRKRACERDPSSFWATGKYCKQ